MSRLEVGQNIPNAKEYIWNDGYESLVGGDFSLYMATCLHLDGESYEILRIVLSSFLHGVQYGSISLVWRCIFALFCLNTQKANTTHFCPVQVVLLFTSSFYH